MKTVAVLGLALLAVRACPLAAHEPQPVEISARLADGQLQLAYRAPAGVQRLHWLDNDARMVREVRHPMLKALDDCGRIEGEELVISDSPHCAHTARFSVQPRVLELNAFNEAAQPSSDGGVLLFTRYYAATAAGRGLRWRFEPPPGGYVVDAAQAWTSAREVEVGASDVERALRTLDAEASWRSLHASHSVFIGRTPMERDGGLLWVRDPALPAGLTGALSETAREAMRGYAAASAREVKNVAVVMLRSDRDGAGFHGDRTDEHMIRLSFTRPADPPSERDLTAARAFVAHEFAHLWNHGVFDSDQDAPWLHEGDAEWASMMLLHANGELSDAALQERLESATSACLQQRGDRAAAGLDTRWSAHQDDPYGCGTALQLLAWAERHARDASSKPLAAWGAMHRDAPMLNAAAFAHEADGDGAPLMRTLLLDAKTSFAPTYLRDLGGFLPLDTRGEPGPMLRTQFAGRLMQRLQSPDCGGHTGFWIKPDQVLIDDGLHCDHLPAGAQVVAVGGEPLLEHPQAAWRAAQAQCARHGLVALGLRGAEPVSLPCARDFPPPPLAVHFEPGALQRLGLAASH